MRLLLAEDDEDLRKVLAARLKRMGHTVAEAADGAEAWLEFDRMPVDVVISDWRMPKMDGLELCAKVRGRARTDYAYFILITAIGQREDMLKCMDAGVDDFLVKPIDPDLLRVRLRVAERILKLESKVQTLAGFLPICATCKKIRDEKTDRFVMMEEFIEKRSGATFSHTYCPECMKKAFPNAPR